MNSPIIDIKIYMQSVGQEARAASRWMAKASTAVKNTALLTMATAIRRRHRITSLVAGSLR